jgi:2-oxoglutarate ferredoxin oxidoreductase subunit alpha
MRLIQGNEACALGAIEAGCSFYAGYPITPASEIMEWMARLLPKKNGTFIQMEDEIASIAAIIGASWSGAKTMTATSGPGFSLMQENLGYATMTETPCVVVNSQRGGPSTGLPTLPSQGDVMQARWGTHGDHPIIVLTTSSVLDTYEMTITAFNLSEAYRIPVVLLLDATISHMRENIEIPEMEIIDRKKPANITGFKAFADESFLPFGVGEQKVVTGLAHGEDGLPRASDGENAEHMLRRTYERMENNLDDILHYKTYHLDDAEMLIISYGITSRASKAAVQILRKEGICTGLLDLQTLWPFPEKLIKELAGKVKGILMPELNLGQMVMPLKAAVEGAVPVKSLTRADGQLFTPDQIAEAVMEMTDSRVCVEVPKGNNQINGGNNHA